MTLKFFRWFSGFASFKAKGKFPERLLNISMKNGIRLWGMRSEGDYLTAYVSAREYKALRPLARSCGLTLKCTKKGGLPFIISQYRPRSGLLVGAVLYVIILLMLSGFVWNISINVSGSINEYELRRELRSLGLYEGARISDIDVSSIERQAVIDMDNIAWISVNISGSLVSVELSPRIDKKDALGSTPSSVTAACDGVITGIEAGSGSPSVKIGEAVTKGQILVNGIIEYETGGFELVHSDARVYAQTEKSLSVSVPLEETILKRTDSCVYKRSLSLLWLELPISLSTTPDGYVTKSMKRESAELIGTRLPIELMTESYTVYEQTAVSRTEQQARTIAENKLSVLEAFSLSDTQSYTKTYTQKISNGELILTGTYTCIEDIAVQQEINTDGLVLK